MEEDPSVFAMMAEVWLSFKPVDQYILITEVECSHKFLKSMFHLIGIEDFETIRKEYKEAEEQALKLDAK